MRPIVVQRAIPKPLEGQARPAALEQAQRCSHVDHYAAPPHSPPAYPLQLATRLAPEQAEGTPQALELRPPLAYWTPAALAPRD